MKYFSISFNQQKQDMPKQSKKINLNSIKSPEKLIRMAISVIFAAGMFYMGEKEMAVFVLISFLLIPFVAKTVFNFSYVKSVYKSKLMNRTVSVDFYDDHLVYNYLPDSNFKGNSERHYGFDTLSNIFELPEMFIFVFGQQGGFNIPKRAINEEQMEMIFNLINNLFKAKYSKVG